MKLLPRPIATALSGFPAAVALAQPAPPSSPVPVIGYEYDANGNPTRTVQAPGVAGFGFTSQRGYDLLDRAKTLTDARGKSTSLGYNARDELLQVQDPRLLSTQYSRNGLGDLASLSSTDTGNAVLTYDSAGNLKTRTDSRGVLATYTYDALNRLTSVVYSQSGQTSLTYTWTYDQTGTGFSNGVGRLTSAAHPSGSLQFSYDPQGHVLSETQVVSGKSGANTLARTLVTSYGYDAGNLTSVTYPSGRVLRIAYTGGLPSSITLARNASATPVALISAIQYESFGAVKSWVWQLNSGTQLHERQFDTSGRTVRYRLGPNLRDLTYDAADRIARYTHYDAATGAPAPSLDQQFGYDELGRLTGISSGGSSWTIGYDDNGNRTSIVLNGSTSAYTVSPTSNRVNAITNPARSLQYDAAGNTKADTYTATYDLAGRMQTLAKAGITTTYAVDGQGRRVRKYSSTGSASTVLYAYDVAGHLIGEYDNTGKELREYVWLGDVPVAVFTPDPAGALRPPLVYYIHTDHLGAPRVAVDRSNAIRWRWLSEPFGVSLAEENPQGLGAFTFNLRLPGQVFDAESGLHYNGMRDYDPTIGRYVQSDPIGLAGGINTYAYVAGNPLSNIDPNGEELVSGLISAGINFSLQMGANYTANGGDLQRAFRCVNWTSVGVAGLVGTFVPGFGAATGTTFKWATGWFGGATADQAASKVGQYLLIGIPHKFGLGQIIRPHRIGDDCECNKNNTGFGAVLHEFVY